MATRPALTAVAASNSFRVLDSDALRAALEPHGVSVTEEPGAEPRVRLGFAGELPASTLDPLSGRQVPLDLPALIAAQLPPGEVAVIKEISAAGDEVHGFALAFDRTGATMTVDLEEITSLADDLAGTDVALVARVFEAAPGESATLSRERLQERARAIAAEWQDATRTA